jgi:hypothetical protein
MNNEDFKYINEAEKCADYMIEHLYEQTLWWMDTDENSDLSEDEFNEVHAQFMKTVLLMLLQE